MSAEESRPIKTSTEKLQSWISNLAGLLTAVALLIGAILAGLAHFTGAEKPSEASEEPAPIAQQTTPPVSTQPAAEPLTPPRGTTKKPIKEAAPKTRTTSDRGVQAEPQPSGGVIQATGFGRPRTSSTGSAGVDEARRAAEVLARAALLEKVATVIERATKVQDGAFTRDVVEQRAKGVVRNARIVSERALPDGRYEVTMEVASEDIEELKQ